MTDPRYVLSDEEVQESWDRFNACGNSHDWVDEPENSNFLKLCTKCGGAQGIRFPEGMIF